LSNPKLPQKWQIRQRTLFSLIIQKCNSDKGYHEKRTTSQKSGYRDLCRAVCDADTHVAGKYGNERREVIGGERRVSIDDSHMGERQPLSHQQRHAETRQCVKRYHPGTPADTIVQSVNLGGKQRNFGKRLRINLDFKGEPRQNGSTPDKQREAPRRNLGVGFATRQYGHHNDDGTCAVLQKILRRCTLIQQAIRRVATDPNSEGVTESTEMLLRKSIKISGEVLRKIR